MTFRGKTQADKVPNFSGNDQEDPWADLRAEASFERKLTEGCTYAQGKKRNIVQEFHSSELHAWSQLQETSSVERQMRPTCETGIARCGHTAAATLGDTRMDWQRISRVGNHAWMPLFGMSGVEKGWESDMTSTPKQHE